MGRLLVVAAPLLALAMVASACGDHRCGAQVCDVREPACQRRAAEVAACLRGLPVPTTTVRVIPFSTWLADAETSATAAPDVQAERTRRAMALLGLAPPGQTAAQASSAARSWVGAYYDPQTKSITILERSQAFDTAYDFGLLVHEFVHAQQDQAFGFERVYAVHPPSTDAYLAVGALVEGDATNVEERAMLALFDQNPDAVDWPMVYRSWQSSIRWNLVRQEDAVAHAPANFRYPFGAPYVANLRAGAGPAVDGAYLNPPATTRSVLFGTKVAPPTLTVDDRAVPVVPGATPILLDRFGSWMFETFLRIHRVPDQLFGVGRTVGDDGPTFDDIVMSLEDDRLAVLHTAEHDGIVVSWRLLFSNVTFAARVREWMRQRRFITWQDEVHPFEVVVLATDDAAVVSALTPKLAFAPAAAPSGEAGTASTVHCAVRRP